MAVTTLAELTAKVRTTLHDLGFRSSTQLFDGTTVADSVEHRNAQVVPGDITPSPTFASIDWKVGMGISIAYLVGQSDEAALVQDTLLPDLQAIASALAVLEETEPGQWMVEVVSAQEGQVVVLVMRVPMTFCQPLP